jgi:hypothetical protein
VKFNSTPVLPAAWMPQQAPPPPPILDTPLLLGTAPAQRDPRETTILPAISYPLPTSADDLFSRARGSAAGYHAVSSMLTCLRQHFLHARIQRKGTGGYNDDSGKMNKRSFGTLIHALLAVRIVYGQEAAEQLLILSGGAGITSGGLPNFGPVGAGISLEDLQKALTIVKMYGAEYPFQIEPWTYLGVEAEVFTDIGDGHGGSCVRTAIYDAVVKRFDQPSVVWSLEKKTASRSGTSVMDQYMPQFSTQCVVWNSNPSLVARYGPMAGVIPDVIVKTSVPKCERHLPRYISRFMQYLTTSWLRLPEEIRYPVFGDGQLPPAMLHACWGKYEPCEFVGLCWEGLFGEYEAKQEK